MSMKKTLLCDIYIEPFAVCMFSHKYTTILCFLSSLLQTPTRIVSGSSCASSAIPTSQYRDALGKEDEERTTAITQCDMDLMGTAI